MHPRGLPVALRRRLISATPGAVRDRARRFVLGETSAQRAVRGVTDRLATQRAARASGRGAGRDQPALIPVSLDGRPRLANPVDTFRAGQAYARHAHLVADAFEAHGVDYFYLRTESDLRRVLVVAETRRAAAVAALEAELCGTGTYLAAVEGDRVHRMRLVEHGVPCTSKTLRVFQILSTADGRFVSGSEVGCDLQFWRVADERTPFNEAGEPISAGSLIGDRSADLISNVIPAAEQSIVVREVDGRARPRLPHLDNPHLFQPRQPIDAVYSWVDGSDPVWRARKDAALQGMGTHELHALSANTSRFHSRDELRYSLRSLEMYADWVRHVYLVTDDQVPPWLDTTNPRITVLSHRELFGDRGKLPTFNSHAIETQIHHIEGLSENYLYLNDDVFLGRPAPRSNFVHANGLAKFFLSEVKIQPGPPGGGDLPVTSAAKNNRDLLVERFGRTVTNKFQHMPHSLRRSVMADLETEFADAFKITAAAPFRNADDISVSASLGHHYGFATGRSLPGRLRYLYADIARPDTADRLEQLLRRRDHDVFCLNDHDSSGVDPETQQAMVQGFLERYYPLPSSFER